LETSKLKDKLRTCDLRKKKSICYSLLYLFRNLEFNNLQCSSFRRYLSQLAAAIVFIAAK